MQLTRLILGLLVLVAVFCGGCNKAPEEVAAPDAKQTERTGEETNKTDSGQPIMGR